MREGFQKKKDKKTKTKLGLSPELRQTVKRLVTAR